MYFSWCCSCFFFSSRRRHTRCGRDWSSDVCSSDLFKNFAGPKISLPEIGFGTWGYRGGVEPLRRAIDLGACLVDTAEAYGTAELVSEATRGGRDRVLIGTQARPSHFRRDGILKSADQILKR